MRGLNAQADIWTICKSKDARAPLSRRDHMARGRLHRAPLRHASSSRSHGLSAIGYSVIVCKRKARAAHIDRCAAR